MKKVTCLIIHSVLSVFIMNLSKLTKLLLPFLSVRIILICIISFGMYNASGADPVTPNASPEARALLNYLYSVYGKKTLSGQMWAPWAKKDEINTVFQITGKYPAIRGHDYINESSNKRENQLVIEWWKSGGIPTLMWHWGDPSASWDPGKAYYDLAGGDTYGKGIQASLFNKLKIIHGETIPIPYHECGTLPDPDECFKNGITWSWWMLWHTNHLYNHNTDELIRIYNHDLVITRDELPNIMNFLNTECKP